MLEEFRTERQNCEPKLVAEIFLFFSLSESAKGCKRILTVSLIRLCECVWKVGCQVKICRIVRHISCSRCISHILPNTLCLMSSLLKRVEICRCPAFRHQQVASANRQLCMQLSVFITLALFCASALFENCQGDPLEFG